MVRITKNLQSEIKKYQDEIERLKIIEEEYIKTKGTFIPEYIKIEMEHTQLKEIVELHKDFIFNDLKTIQYFLKKHGLSSTYNEGDSKLIVLSSKDNPENTKEVIEKCLNDLISKRFNISEIKTDVLSCYLVYIY